VLTAHYVLDQAQAHLPEGFTKEVVRHFVREHNIGVLRMGTIARGHLDNLLIDHTAQRVLQRLECDPLVIKRDGKG